MARLILASVLALPFQPARQYHGLAAQHRSLARVATLRGMDATGILFASPIVPIGTTICLNSRRMPGPVCGVAVDTCQPRHCAWQVRTKRIVEVQPDLARRLCDDPTGLPKMCPVKVWREKS